MFRFISVRFVLDFLLTLKLTEVRSVYMQNPLDGAAGNVSSAVMMWTQAAYLI